MLLVAGKKLIVESALLALENNQQFILFIGCIQYFSKFSCYSERICIFNISIVKTQSNVYNLCCILYIHTSYKKKKKNLSEQKFKTLFKSFIITSGLRIYCHNMFNLFGFVTYKILDLYHDTFF